MNNSEGSNGGEDSGSDATTPAAAATHGGRVAEELPPPTAHPSPYEEGEMVIASHGEHFYKAKVEKVAFQENWSFLIHYHGWKKSWDEWVGIDRLMKYSEENSQKLSHDTKHFTEKYRKAMRASHTNPDTYFVNGRKPNKSSVICRKRKTEHLVVKGIYDAAIENHVNISIPPTLKKQLMDDFEFINKMSKLVKLPRTPNVDDILQKYRDFREKEGVMSPSVGEVLSGLHAYFNKALPVILLYNKERQQYQEAITDNVYPSGIYGAEHLLRLFVKLPALLHDLSIEEEAMRDLQLNLHDILKFLQKNQSVFFLSTNYVPEA